MSNLQFHVSDILCIMEMLMCKKAQFFATDKKTNAL